MNRQPASAGCRKGVIQTAHSATNVPECLQMAHQWIKSRVTGQNRAYGLRAARKLLAQVERNVEVERIRAVAGDLDPLQARAQRLCLHDELVGQISSA